MPYNPNNGNGPVREDYDRAEDNREELDYDNDNGIDVDSDDDAYDYDDEEAQPRNNRKRRRIRMRTACSNLLRDPSCLSDAERDELHVEIYEYLVWLRDRLEDVSKKMTTTASATAAVARVAPLPLAWMATTMRPMPIDDGPPRRGRGRNGGRRGSARPENIVGSEGRRRKRRRRIVC